MCKEQLEQVGGELFRAARFLEDRGYPTLDAVRGIIEAWGVSTTPPERLDPGIAVVAAGFARAEFHWIVSED